VKSCTVIHNVTGGGFGGKANGLQTGALVEYFTEKQKHSISHMLSVEYRLMGLDVEERSNTSKYAAKFQDQLDDCMKAYKWLIEEKKVDPKDVIFIGDSFGPVLLSNMLAIIGKENPERLPHSAILISGCFDLSAKTIQSTYNEEDTVVVSRNNIDVIEDLYQHEPESYSPINYDPSTISAFNSTKLLVVYSLNEEATKDNELFVEELKKNNYPSLQVIAEVGQVHGFPYFCAYSPKIKTTMDQIANFMEE